MVSPPRRSKGNEMATCVYCGSDFNVSSARRSIARSYGAGTYDDYYPDGDVCDDCARSTISADCATGAEVLDLCGYWDD